MENPNIKLFKQLVNSTDYGTLIKLRRVIEKRLRSFKDNDIIDIKKISHGALSGDSGKKSFEYIMNDDWDYLFSKYSGLDDEPSYYVYFHLDPSKSAVFSYKYNDGSKIKFKYPIYVGKGQGDRLYNFRRSNLHTAQLRSFGEKGFHKKQIAIKVFSGLTEMEALILESKLILFFGCIGSSLRNHKSFCGRLPLLYNQQYEPYPIEYDRFDKCNKGSGAAK